MQPMDFLRLPHFLGHERCQELYQYCLSQQSSFVLTTLGPDSGYVDVGYRNSLRLSDLGMFESIFNEIAMESAAQWAEALGLSKFTADSCEMEVVAHLDGGFFKRHTDTFTQEDRSSGFDRVLTLVYYLHGQKKSYEGGELKLYTGLGLPIAGGQASVEVVPQQDTAIVFSSWMPHEVLPVRTRTGQFSDARFSVNCWILTKPSAK